jgi:hypothetical protein
MIARAIFRELASKASRARWEFGHRRAIRPPRTTLPAVPRAGRPRGASRAMRTPNNNGYLLRFRYITRIVITARPQRGQARQADAVSSSRLGHGFWRAKAGREKGETSWDHEANTERAQAEEE